MSKSKSKTKGNDANKNQKKVTNNEKKNLEKQNTNIEIKENIKANKNEKNKEDKAKKKIKTIQNKEGKTEKSEEISQIKKEKLEKIEEKEIREIGKIIKNEIKKKMPEEVVNKVVNQVFKNIGILILIIVYFVFLCLGFKNIENNILVTDLKVFSISILFIAIFLFEKSYKKEDRKIAIFGIETLFIAFSTMVLLYIDIINSKIYLNSVLIMTVTFMVYYLIKSLIIYLITKRKYNKENNELNSIKEEVD